MTQPASVLEQDTVDDEPIHLASCFSDDVAVCGLDISGMEWEEDDSVPVNCHECELRWEFSLPCNDERCDDALHLP